MEGLEGSRVVRGWKFIAALHFSLWHKRLLGGSGRGFKLVRAIEFGSI